MAAKLIVGKSSSTSCDPLDDPSITIPGAVGEFLTREHQWDSQLSRQRKKICYLYKSPGVGPSNLAHDARNSRRGHRREKHLFWKFGLGACSSLPIHRSLSLQRFPQRIYILLQCPSCGESTPKERVDTNLDCKVNFAERPNFTYFAPTNWIIGDSQKS